MCSAGTYTVINRIFRCFITNNRTTINKAYITYAIPHVAFSTTIWNPEVEARKYFVLKSKIKKVNNISLVALRPLLYENRLTNLK